MGERRQSQYGPGGAQTPTTSQCEMSPAAHGVRARRARRRGVGVDVDVMLHLAPRGRRGRRRRASTELPPSFDNFSATENFPNFHQNPHTIGLYFYMRVRGFESEDQPMIEMANVDFDSAIRPPGFIPPIDELFIARSRFTRQIPRME